MSIINKIIQKLHLSEFVYNMVKSSKRRSCMLYDQTPEEAIQFLRSKSPDCGQSCIVNIILPPPDCDVEIIVPCYNAERYVEECIDSILAQNTKYSFFITIINDGSTDRTRQILKKYENLDKISIIDQENRGHSGARNTGIGQAHGRYLMFVDSDDVLLPGAIDTLMTLAENNNADVVDSGHIRFADRTLTNFWLRIMADIYDVIQRPQALPLNISSQSITGFPCGKLWKRELFQKVHFPLGYWFEDTIVWMILEPMCNRKVTSNAITFRYRMNRTSVSHTAPTFNKSIDTLYITLCLLRDRERLGIKFNQYQYENLLHQMKINFIRVVEMDIRTKNAVFVIERDIIVKHFTKWSTNNHKVKPIELYLRSNDYEGFALWCKWH